MYIFNYILISELCIWGILCEIISNNDATEEKALKCDACQAVAFAFGEMYLAKQGTRKKLKNEEIVEATEATCDSPWEGFKSTLYGGMKRLTGPGLQSSKESSGSVLLEEDSTLWEKRLQDMCDEFLSELDDERQLYNVWQSDRTALEAFICKGKGIFSACSSDDWGTWPGDEYEDYDEGDDSDMYFHDEF